MTPDKFIADWRAADLTERAASQSHFIDLCALLGIKAPYADDPTDGEYAFGKGAAKTGDDGWTNVWKRGDAAGSELALRRMMQASSTAPVLRVRTTVSDHPSHAFSTGS